jgi:hypothetical protein
MPFTPRLYAHVYVRRAIQRTCIAHDVRSHTYNRERGHIHPCIRVCRHSKYKHACMPSAYADLHSSAQGNSIYRTQTCPTTMHSCEQVCTHLSVWSVELWASAAAMCCAPSAPMELARRLYAHVYVRRAIQRTCVAHDPIHTTPCIRACRHTKYEHACMPSTYADLHSSAQSNSIYRV